MAILRNIYAGDDPDVEDPADDEHNPGCTCSSCEPESYADLEPDDEDEDDE
jgi:hypothetical protein